MLIWGSGKGLVTAFPCSRALEPWSQGGVGGWRVPGALGGGEGPRLQGNACHQPSPTPQISIFLFHLPSLIK